MRLSAGYRADQGLSTGYNRGVISLRLSLVVVSFLLLTAQAPLVPSQSPPAPPPREAGVAVEVLDAKGEPPRPGRAVELSVAEDGAARRVLGAGPVPAETPWRVVIWVDRVLSGSRTVRGAAGALAAQAPALVALGTVEVVVAEPEPRVVLAPTRDVRLVDEALSRLLLQGEGRDDLRLLRQRFADSVGAPTSGPAGTTGTSGATEAEEAMAAEVRLVSRQQDALVGWLAPKEQEDKERPRALFVVSDGFDLDPRAFYINKVDAASRPALEGSLTRDALDAASLETARTVAELGWTAIPLPVGDERLPEIGRFRTGGIPGMPSVTVRPGRSQPAPPPPPPPVLVAPREPLVRMAEASGGEVLSGGAEVARAVARLRSRLWLRFEAPAPPAAVRLEVRAADAGLKVKARRWEGPANPAGVSAWRARGLLLEDEEEAGELEVAAALRDGALELRLGPAVRPTPAGPLRLTVAVPQGESGAVLTQRELTAGEVSAEGVFTLPLSLPADTDRVAVLVDDPARGSWGGRTVPVGEEGAAGEEDEEAAGAEAALLAQPPAARLSERRAGGNGVRIVKPASERGTGPVDVEVEVSLPSRRRLERLEIFWNEELQATLYKPPFRHRLLVPRDRPVGTLRAEARLDDGSVAEDAMLLNGSALGERVDVRLVELMVVVTDKAGRPVRDLGRDDFRLLQDGRDQTIASFDDAGEFPITVGLTVDSSASMFVKLPGVVEAARSLLSGGLTARDSALLVGFATDPRLLVAPTRNLRAVSAGLGTLVADGGSNLFAAIQFSLRQLQSGGGRKALIIYSDGIGEGEGGYGDCLRAARASGVPIYLIVTNATAVHAAAEGAPVGRYVERLERLAAATGAKAYFVLPTQDLKPVYAEILRELRSQYLVAYYPHAASLDAWRKVEVEVKKPGLRARTLSGYYARP
jgi:VWFA-related protein